MTKPGSALGRGAIDEDARLPSLAHDLHSLLAVVITYAALARKTLPDGHPAEADMAKIAHAARQAGPLVNTLASRSMPHD